jgi:hypothetical protein
MRKAAFAAVLALAVVLGLTEIGRRASLEAACFDPTEACSWSVVVVRDDTHQPVVLRACMHHCGQGDRRLDPVAVKPGEESAREQYGAVYALVDGLSWWAVEDRAGNTLGCLVLDGHGEKRDGDLLLVSQRRPCTPQQPAVKPVGRATVRPL